MNDILPPDAYLSEPERNHRRQAVWQIYLPLMVGAAAFLMIAIFVLVGYQNGGASLGRFAAIAIIWMILPVLALGLIALVINILMIFLFSKIQGALPDYGRLARFYLFRISIQIRNLADKLVAPDIALESRIAGWKQIFSVFRKK